MSGPPRPTRLITSHHSDFAALLCLHIVWSSHQPSRFVTLDCTYCCFSQGFLKSSFIYNCKILLGSICLYRELKISASFRFCTNAANVQFVIGVSHKQSLKRYPCSRQAPKQCNTESFAQPASIRLVKPVGRSGLGSSSINMKKIETDGLNVMFRH